MAKKEQKDYQLPLNTIIEVVCTKGDKVIKNTMTYAEALELKTKKGWICKNYQVGFCSLKEN